MPSSDVKTTAQLRSSFITELTINGSASSEPEAEVTFIAVRLVYDTITLVALFADLPEQSAIPQIISNALTR